MRFAHALLAALLALVLASPARAQRAPVQPERPPAADARGKVTIPLSRWQAMQDALRAAEQPRGLRHPDHRLAPADPLGRRECHDGAGLADVDVVETVEQRAREAAAPADTRLLARHVARPWGEVLRHLNKTSDNAEARLLYLLLGAPLMAANPQLNTAELAAREVRAWFAENRIDSAGLVLDNGSGLSRSERISPQQMTALLRAAWNGRHAHDFIATLPTAGVDGTLRNRLKTGPATGWARLKTGTLKNVVGLAGYVNDSRGRPWAVAMMVNHDNAPRARPVLDALVDAFARGNPSGFVRRGPVVGPQGEGP